MSYERKAQTSLAAIQFGGLLVLTVVVAVPLGWTMSKVRQQRRIVAELEKAGCSVQYDGGSHLVPRWLKSLLGDDMFWNVTKVDGSKSQIHDSGFIQLRKLPRLQVLNLDQTRVTDAGLIHIEPLTQLRSLNLSWAKVTDAGLVHLQGLSRLQLLSLKGTQVTDAGLLHLQRLAELQTLDLEWQNVSDAGMAHLRGLMHLQRLILGERV